MEAELAQTAEEQYAALDAETMIRSAGLVRFKQHDEGRYLGASSGIAMTRLVMELAKHNTDSKSIKEIVPETKAGQIKDRFAMESSKPTSKIYPLVSDVAAPDLPSRELVGNLVNVFNRTGNHSFHITMPSFLSLQLNTYCPHCTSHPSNKMSKTCIWALRTHIKTLR